MKSENRFFRLREAYKAGRLAYLRCFEPECLVDLQAQGALEGFLEKGLSKMCGCVAGFDLKEA